MPKRKPPGSSDQLRDYINAADQLLRLKCQCGHSAADHDFMGECFHTQKGKLPFQVLRDCKCKRFRERRRARSAA